MTLSLKMCGALVFVSPIFGSPFFDAPDHLAGLGVERDQRGVGLLQEDLAVAVGQAAVDGVAAHHRDDGRVLLRLVLPLERSGPSG